MQEISADKAYISMKNLKATEDHGAVPFIPFKSNAQADRGTDTFRANAPFRAKPVGRLGQAAMSKRNCVEVGRCSEAAEWQRRLIALAERTATRICSPN